METINLYLVVAILVAVLFPGYAILYGKKTVEYLTSNPDKKNHVYRITAIQLIVLSIISLVPFLVDQSSLGLIGLGFIYKPYWLMSLFAISFLVLWLLDQITLSKDHAQKISRQSARVKFLHASNNKEYKHMIMVSFIAGICEEIIYRGFLFWFLTSYMPLIPSIILANLPFALAHLTSTGIKNTIQAFILALIFTGAFLLTNSLWLPILLHILVDLYATTIAYKSSQILETVNQ